MCTYRCVTVDVQCHSHSGLSEAARVLFKCLKPGQIATVFVNALQGNRTSSVCMYCMCDSISVYLDLAHTIGRLASPQFTMQTNKKLGKSCSSSLGWQSAGFFPFP